MFAMYVDEAGVGDKRLEPWMLVACALIDGDQDWRSIERTVKQIIQEDVPERLRANFEFKADALWGGRKPFDGWDRAERVKVQRRFLQTIADHRLPVTWGAVDRLFYEKERGELLAMRSD